jgi:D-alanyl-D-alanine carboxypeptidase/D-alanyl-D-alanine-endopeptidase (penicillin-binding protein 4)
MEAPTRRSLRESGKSGRPISSGKRGGAAGDGESPKRRGIQAIIAKHPTAWLASALAVAFLLLGTAAVFAGVAAGSGASGAAPVPSESAAPPRPQPSAFPAASRLRTCSVAALASDPVLAALSGSVINATTGEILFDRNGTVAASPASILKVLTAAAALQTLGPDYRITTTVMAGSSAGTIVLKGGGDPTLATTSGSFYEGAPLLQDLADAAIARHDELYPGVPITQVVLDATLWDPANGWDETWPASERTDGYMSYVTALMVDGDRADPTESVSPRGTDPVGDAGEAFVNALGLPGVSLTRGSAVSSTVLASVQSQPVSVLIPQMLLTSDNTLAEMLARVVSKAQGFDGSPSSLDSVISGALTGLGLTPTGITVHDGSGLSALNAVPPQLVAQLMVLINARSAPLDIIYSGMPVAGESGDLYNRFTDANAVAAGAVVAKPGWLETEWSLAGIVAAADGTPLTFAFYAIGEGITRDARYALDTLTTGVYSCGDNLANN